MAPKVQQTSSSKRKSLIVIASQGTTDEDAVLTEIAAEISVPMDGGWGWVVVFASFLCIFLTEGTLFTFGAVFEDMTNDLGVNASLVALLNSVAIALYFIMSPVASAIINAWGFRSCAMLGSILYSFAYTCSYFSKNYLTLLFFYGIMSGIGACLIGMPSTIVVTFYFERLRAIALALSGAGSSLGIMIWFSVNSYLVNLAGWRITTLLHAGCLGLVYFIAMAFKPVLSLTVMHTTEDPTRTVTYLPNVSATQMGRASDQQIKATVTERLFGTVENQHFPTAAAVIEEGVLVPDAADKASESVKSKLTGVAEDPQGKKQQGQSVSRQDPGTSTDAGRSKLTVITHNPQGVVSGRQVNQIKSLMSRPTVAATGPTLDIVVQGPPPKKRNWLARLCHWDKHVSEARPMYKDDAFYTGAVKQLSAYKSMLQVPEAERTGLEYQMAVTRAVAVSDLEEHRGFCATKVKRVLATMLDPVLLRRFSFLLLCSHGFFVSLGMLIPYMFVAIRNKGEGMPEHHCTMLVSSIGLANFIGRLLTGLLALKLNPVRMYISAVLSTGFFTLAFNFNFEVWYQYVCCIMFGMSIASFFCIRSILLVNIYGLDKLTNTTGILLLFQGLGSLISTPLISVISSIFGYDLAFYLAGMIIIISGIILLPVEKIAKREDRLNSQAK